MKIQDGLELLKQKKYTESIEVFKKNIKNGFLKPKEESDCLVYLANACFKLEKYDNAMLYLQNALSLSPGNPVILKFIHKVSKSIVSTPILSLNMIVKNEETDLALCLDSIVEVTDELIITDTGSTDKTIEIAQKYNANVQYFDWIDDYASARNISLKSTTGKWILYLDADERLSQHSVLEIRKLINDAPEDCGGFLCRVDNAHSLDSTGVMQGSYPRLFRNLGYPKIKFFGRVHEQISPSIFEAGLSIYPSEIVIKHIGYDISRPELEAKVKRNLSMLSAHVTEEPTNGFAWYQLGQTLAQMRLFEQAESALLSAVETKNLSNYILSTTALTLANIARRTNRYDEALLWADMALRDGRDKVPATHLKASVLLMLGKGKEAENEYNKLQELLENNSERKDFHLKIPDVTIMKGIDDARKLQGLCSL